VSVLTGLPHRPPKLSIWQGQSTSDTFLPESPKAAHDKAPQNQFSSTFQDRAMHLSTKRLAATHLDDETVAFPAGTQRPNTRAQSSRAGDGGAGPFNCP